MPDPHIGPTNRFPEGKITPDDQGALVLAIIADEEHNLVAIEFGTSLTWFGMTPPQALNIGRTLIQAAMKLTQQEARSMTPTKRDGDAANPE